MTKQEEIREGIKDIYARELKLGYEGQFLNDDEVVESVIQYLRSQRVVIKIDREVPECTSIAHGVVDGVYVISDEPFTAPTHIMDTCAMRPEFEYKSLIGESDGG